MKQRLLCGLMTAFIVTPIWADDMNCGSDLVQPGDSIESLLEKCGEPDGKIDDYWIYKKDNNYQVSISQGTVSEIKTLYE